MGQQGLPEKDHLEAIWGEQLRFTREFWETRGGMPDFNDDVVITPVVKDYILHLIKEATEVLDEISWRMHRKSKEFVNRENVLEELVDVNKFNIGLMQILGFTLPEYRDAFIRKSLVVQQRFDQERSLPRLRDLPCALVDIDGVLAEYPGYYRRWAADHGMAWDSEDLLERERVKREYRMSGAKASASVVPGARELLVQLRASGIKVVLLTMRPYAEYYRIYPDTLEWLAKNDLQYDAILWAREKGLEALKNFTKIYFAVDDDPKNVAMYLKAGIAAYGVGEQYGTTTEEFAREILPKAIAASREAVS